MVALVIGKIPFTPQHVNGACQNRLEMHTAKVARHRADIRRLRIIEIRLLRPRNTKFYHPQIIYFEITCLFSLIFNAYVA
jgi:hypothetical protein